MIFIVTKRLCTPNRIIAVALYAIKPVLRLSKTVSNTDIGRIICSYI